MQRLWMPPAHGHKGVVVSIYTSVIANLVFPLQEKIKSHDTVALRKSMEESQWWPRERMEAFRLARLRTLLEKAGKNVPYYRECFSSLGIDVRNLTSLADLQKLPF